MMTTEPQDKEELLAALRKATLDLSQRLAMMHGTLMNLVLALRTTKLSNAQRLAVDAALSQLLADQKAFLAEYADMVGGANPENN